MENKPVDIKTLDPYQLTLLLSEQYKQAFQINQNIAAIEALARGRDQPQTTTVKQENNDAADNRQNL